MGFGGDVGDDLDVETNADGGHRGGKRPVIPTAAASQSAALRVKGQAGNKHDGGHERLAIGRLAHTPQAGANSIERGETKKRHDARGHIHARSAQGEVGSEEGLNERVEREFNRAREVDADDLAPSRTEQGPQGIGEGTRGGGARGFIESFAGDAGGAAQSRFALSGGHNGKGEPCVLSLKGRARAPQGRSRDAGGVVGFSFALWRIGAGAQFGEHTFIMARGENALIAVAGAPTAVTNNAIAGILDELGQSDHITEIYGAITGLAGALDGRVVDLGAQKRKTIEGLRRTPGSVLGGRVRYLGDDDAAPFVAALKGRGIGTLFLIGGLPAVELGKFALAAAKSGGYELSVLVVPASPENEVTAGDHCIGYGSAARAASVAARDGARGAQGGEEPIVVLEIGGAGAGWLAASTALARDEFNAAPHSILLPERPVDVDELVEETRRATQKYGFALLVTTDGASSTAGDSLGGAALADILADRLNLPSRWDKIGLITSVSGANIARADADEAYNLGALVAKLSVEDASGYAVALNRADEGRGERGYKVVEASLRLEQVEEFPRTLPDHYISASGTGVTEEFLEWARPLLGGALPEYATLG